MPDPRFLLTPEQLNADPVVLAGADFRHCRVLRLQAGDTVRLCDGAGREYEARLERLLADRAEARLGRELAAAVESPLAVTLYQGWARGDKLDWTLQKATEIGLARFVPMVTRHSQVQPREGGGHKLERWREIARQAARQSGRTRIPEVAAPLTFPQALAEARALDLALMPYEGARATEWRARLAGRPAPARVAILVGPEGGFAPEEAEEAERAGVLTLGLGPRILRSETAGLVAATLALFVWGDLGGRP